MAINNPSLNPENNDSLVGTFATVLNKAIQSIDGILPAQVINFISGPPDYVNVQPLIKVVGTDGESISRAPVNRVPVCQIGGGGFVIRLNLKTGDQGLLIASDRDISPFMVDGKESQPKDYRMKDFSFSFFLPLVFRDFLVSEDDISNVIIQNLDNSVSIELLEDSIKMKGNIEFENDVLIDGKLTVNGRTIVYGNINCGGDITAAGSITPGTPIPP